MSRHSQSSPSRKKRKVVRSKDIEIIVRGVQHPEPDYKHLARAMFTLAKDMHQAKELGLSVEEYRRQKYAATPDD